MGKNDHGPRGKKKAPKNLSTVPESEHIVFSRSNDQPKNHPNGMISGKKPTGREGTQTRSEDGQLPKRPDVRTLIGGNASWSGKLPVNLLSEHCQKQRWEKPDYSMRQNGDGFESSVTLKYKNPKTQELSTLPPFRLPSSHRHLGIQPTALEARHFAAVYALFRVSSMKNIQMALPPAYRGTWKGTFAELKQQDVKKGNGWQYEADPFTAHRAQDAAKAEAARKVETTRSVAEDSRKASQGPSRSFSHHSKAWDRAPSAEMGPKLREDVEGLARNQALWNAYNVTMLETQKTTIVNSISQLGFRRSHIEEAVSVCQNEKEVLEWLLIHVPEDDLPPWCLPEGYVAGVSFASGDIVKDTRVKRLAEAGYSLEMCNSAYRQAEGDVGIAAALLQAALLHQPPDSLFNEIGRSCSDEWRDEMMALSAIFGNRFSSQESEVCCIEVDNKVVSFELQLRFCLPRKSYPDWPPTLAIISKSLPSHVRLSATKQVIHFAEESLLGSAMIFNMVEWVESNIHQISQSPGPLRDVTPKPILEIGTEIKQPINNRFVARKPRIRRLGSPGDSQSKRLKAAWETRHILSQQQTLLKARQGLPAWSIQQDVIEKINRHQVTIVSGATGSGKSTQCVQFILDEMIKKSQGSATNIVCTQPRRISAIGLAERVSAERCSTVGEEVGYMIRGDSKISTDATRITFMTTGVLLRRLQSAEVETDSLPDVSHVFVDEVHERSLDTDILLALLRALLKSRPTIKLVMMSATFDAQTFVNYFGGQSCVGQVEIAGRTFPITDCYLDDILEITGHNGTTRSRATDDYEEDHVSNLKDDFSSLDIGRQIRSLGMGINYELIASLVKHIDSKLGKETGSVLIFLPGVAEIERCLNALKQLRNIHALPLHASLTAAEQRRVFDRPPYGLRKIIAATNVAETSITIDDTVAVIDSGRVKETSYDTGSSMVRLEELWCSQSACQQRRGRAGRVRPGTCYKLFTRKVESEMPPRPEPEIRRVPLEQLCLSVKATHSSSSQDVAAFLRQTLTPPEDAAVETALALLHRIGALDNTHLTALGRYLSLIPVDLRLAKLLVFGSIFSLLEPCLTIATILSERSPFVSPRDKRDDADAARKAFSKSPADGDLLLSLYAYEEWTARVRESGFSSARSWANASFLSTPTLQTITATRTQLLRSLNDAGVVVVPSSPPYATAQTPTQHQPQQQPSSSSSYSPTLLRALIAGSLSPQYASIAFPSQKFAPSISGSVALDAEARTIKYFISDPPPLASKNDDPTTPTTPTTTSTPPPPTPTTRVFLHPSSSLFSATPSSFPTGTHFLAYFSRMQTSKPFVRDLTPFNVYALLLFGGGGVEVDPSGPGVLVDGTWRVRGWPRIGVLVGRLRRGLDEVIRERVERIERGAGGAAGGGGGNGEGSGGGMDREGEERLLKVVARLVEFNGLDR